MREDQRKRNCIRENCEAAFEIALRHALNQLARIYMYGAGSGAGGRLLLNALRLPSPNLFPIHDAISRRSSCSTVFSSLRRAFCLTACGRS